MFINQAIVAIIFRLVNFVIIVALGAYAFKKYIMPAASILMAKKEAEKELLFSQQMLLEYKQSELDQLTKQEAVQSENFKIKIDAWKRVTDGERAFQAKEHSEKRAAIAKKNHKKQELREQMHIQREVAKAVILDLQSYLPGHFEKQNVGADYISSIVCFMDERVS